MANAADIAQLRAFISEPLNEDPYSDQTLAAAIDALGSVREAAADVWRQKAAGVASLVNVSEGGSSRSMGSLYSQYLAMAKEFSESPEAIAAAAAPRTTRIQRA